MLLQAVGTLTTSGEFALANIGDDAISIGVLTMHHDDASGCSYRGRQYYGNSHGDVVVPAEAAAELSAHGFVATFEEKTVLMGRTKSSPGNRSKKG